MLFVRQYPYRQLFMTHCNVLLYGLSDSTLKILQRVQNYAALRDTIVAISNI